jgi:poly(3-hydroxybutyrate) depolymerase
MWELLSSDVAAESTGRAQVPFSAAVARRSLVVFALLCVACVLPRSVDSARAGVRTLTFSYRSSTGVPRTAYLVLPSWYGPSRHPAIPFVISPHGRGVDGAYNLRFWGVLPGKAGFALVSPDGQGRRFGLYSWGYRGQIDDLARMPSLARRAFPWLTIEPRRIYAIGDSMGGQEVLLLAARRDVRLAGVVAFDPVTSMAARYRRWPVTPGEARLPALARAEFGGTPAQVPAAYAARSPDSYAAAIARRGIPLQLWWSHDDRVVTDQAQETGAFYRRLIALAPDAPVQEIVGYWQHAHEMHPSTQLPAALACLGLEPAAGIRVPAFAQPDGRTGPVDELPPGRTVRRVPFTNAFCGRRGR